MRRRRGAGCCRYQPARSSAGIALCRGDPLRTCSSMVAKVNPMAPRAFGIVPGEGVEPSRGCPRRFLRPLRLPFRHPGRVDSVPAQAGNRSTCSRVPSNAWTTRRSSSGHAAATAMPLQQLSLATRMSSTRWHSGFSGPRPMPPTSFRRRSFAPTSGSRCFAARPSGHGSSASPSTAVTTSSAGASAGPPIRSRTPRATSSSSRTPIWAGGDRPCARARRRGP